MLFLGSAGATGSLAFTSGSTGTFSGAIQANTSTTAGTVGTLGIQSGATVSGSGLFIAPGVFANSGTVTINGAASALTLTGAATATIGAAGASTAPLNVQSGGTFTSGTGVAAVNATGTVAIAGGTFNANGDLTLNGGQLTRDAAGVFNLAAGKTLAVQGGGDALFTGAYTHSTASFINVTGAGATDRKSVV